MYTYGASHCSDKIYHLIFPAKYVLWTSFHQGLRGKTDKSETMKKISEYPFPGAWKEQEEKISGASHLLRSRNSKFVS